MQKFKSFLTLCKELIRYSHANKPKQERHAARGKKSDKDS